MVPGDSRNSTKSSCGPKGKVYSVILAGGIGSRFGDEIPKQLIYIDDRTILEHAIAEFDAVDCIDEIIVVTHNTIKDRVEDIISQAGFSKPIRVVLGGRTRIESSSVAVANVQDDDLVLLHDAVRPFLTVDLIMRCLEALKSHDAVYPVVPSVNTLVKSVDCAVVDDIPKRSEVLTGQTPQGFKGWVIRKAHAMARTDPHGEHVTNDCALVHKYGITQIHLVRGERQNVKITYPEDIVLASKYLEIKERLTKVQAQEYSQVGLNGV